MIRDNTRTYRHGVGYVQNEDGSVIEEYWKTDELLSPNKQLPAYRIKMIGVTGLFLEIQDLIGVI